MSFVNPLLFRIALSAILSIASLAVILLRVSPLVSPTVAVPFFFITVFLSIATVSALILYGIWSLIPIEGLDAGRKLTVSLREGVFLAAATLVLIVFHLLGILTWWIAALIYSVFLLVELALHT